MQRHVVRISPISLSLSLSLSLSRKQTSTVRASRERRRLIAGSITGCNFISSPGRWAQRWWRVMNRWNRTSQARVRANGFPCTATRVWIRPWNDFTRGDVGRRLTRTSILEWPCNLATLFMEAFTPPPRWEIPPLYHVDEMCTRGDTGLDIDNLSWREKQPLILLSYLLLSSSILKFDLAKDKTWRCEESLRLLSLKRSLKYQISSKILDFY